MADRLPIDQLDDAVAAILAQREVDPTVDPEVAALAAVARDLQGLPTEQFKGELMKQLLRRDLMSSPAPKTEVTVVRRLSVYLCFKDASAAIDFYREAFGAKEVMRLTEPSGKIGHAELEIGDSLIMLSDEYPDYGALSPETIGGSPVRIHLDVDDVDAFARQAISAGAIVSRPIADQFYGDRSGQLRDPFGYTWTVSTHLKDVSVEEMQKQFDEFSKQHSESASKGDESLKTKKARRPGLYSVTPYMTVQQPAELIDFVTKAFHAKEHFRTTGSAGGMHAEVEIGDSIVMIGGAPHIPPQPTAIHLYVPDVDDAYQRALEAGGTSLMEPADQPYGERGAGVQDPTGNRWYIATTFVPLKEIAEDLHTVTLYFHPIGAQRFIEFLETALGGKELMRSESDEGVILHAKVQIGDSVIELGEARAPSQPMPTAIYLFVDDVDTMYDQALKAGATSMLPPTDQAYGDRNAWVKDPFDNVWYLATTVAG
jgi:PhnB protein